MNRTQKKCFIAVIGFHLLLILILFVGPAFLSRNEAQDMPVIDFIPPRLIDAPFSGGGNPNANPQPAPIVRPPQAQPQSPPQQRQQVVPPAPKPQPEVKQVERRETVREVRKPDVDSETAKPEPKRSKPQVSTKLVTRSEAQPSTQKQSNSRTASQTSREFTEAARRIREGASSSTEIEMPGVRGGGEAYANYDQVVKSIYTHAWIAPTGVDDDEATAKISVTIARDGTVISARIIQSSGNSAVDRSVQDALDRVKFIAPFPEGSKDSERSYKINFNLKAKKLLG